MSYNMKFEFDNSGNVPLRVPGFGHGIAVTRDDMASHEEAFAYGPNGLSVERMTIRELAMLQLMDAITDKPDWQRKIKDESITMKWRAEAAALPGSLISDKTFDWCMTELRDMVPGFKKNGLIRTLEGGMRVVKSDTSVSQELQQQLREAVKPLLEVEPAKKDWHPNSNEQVLNLVHPSLYPLVYGKTRALEIGRVGLLNCMDATGRGTIVGDDDNPPEPTRRRGYGRPEESAFWSTRFQWLPAEVKFQGESGTEVKITSYINNLHPEKHQVLYLVVEKLISIAIPAWNGVLTKGYDESNHPRIQTLRAEVTSAEQPTFDTKWDDDNPDSEANQEVMRKLRDYLRLPNIDECPRNHDDVDVVLPRNWEVAPISEWEGTGPYDWNEGSWNLHDVLEWKESRLRYVKIPEPGDEVPYSEWAEKNDRSNTEAMPNQFVTLEDEFRKAGLQVIVKIASIELTPEKPTYGGGSWHLEGMKNEHIAATALYYYDVENCTPSRLCFRQEASLDELELEYEQGDHGPLSRLFGTRQMYDEPAIQEIGGVSTRDGRLLVFPNSLQHRVEPFELEDKSRPGHRRFVALWLVDPMIRIMSTANVPPQQEEWWDQHVRPQNWERHLPQEIKDQIIDYAKEERMSLKEAKELRLELMAERTVYGHSVENSVEQYNLCEH